MTIDSFKIGKMCNDTEDGPMERLALRQSAERIVNRLFEMKATKELREIIDWSISMERKVNDV